MQYRRFGKLGWQASALGFGAMRLPLIDRDPAHIDESEAIRMIRHAVDRGVNYLDTAYPYHKGQSEVVVGKALQDGFRERVHLATKMPLWLVKSPDDFDRYFDEQLARLQTDYLDFYLLHGLRTERWQALQPLKVFEWAEKQIRRGRIRHLGFSFHDNFDLFREIVDAYDGWTFCQIQYNYMDEEEQAGVRGLRYAAGKGLAVIVMEPLRGGMLATTPPAPVQAIWDADSRRRTPVEWALQWVWNQPEVSLLLSGMSTMAQLEENLAVADASATGCLAGADLALIASVRDAYLAAAAHPVHHCKYCQPCPNDVAVPDVFAAYNRAFMYNAPDLAGRFYQGFVAPEHGADRCLQCGDCESQCPQHIAIMEWLPKAHAFLMGS